MQSTDIIQTAQDIARLDTLYRKLCRKATYTQLRRCLSQEDCQQIVSLVYKAEHELLDRLN
jgi:hypothetical protein